MPVVRLSYPRGALTQARKARLAADLTEIVLAPARRTEIARAIGRG